MSISVEELSSKIEEIDYNPRDRISVMVDVYWPHPLIAENPVMEQKCHKVQMMEFPSILFLGDNKKLIGYFNNRFKDPYTGAPIVGKVSCVYNEWLAPEKIVVMLTAPLRMDPIDASSLPES